MKQYGTELILDMKGGDPKKFTRVQIEVFMKELCDLLGMERADLHFWDYDNEEEKAEAPDHLCGTTAIQFIYTSNITIHTLDRTGSVMLNIFSCKSFDHEEATRFCISFFSVHTYKSQTIGRYS